MSDGTRMPRRDLITAGGLGWLALTGSAAAGLWATGRFLRPGRPTDADTVVDAGLLGRYLMLSPGHALEVPSPAGIWLVRVQNRLVALSATCTHLGCRVAWNADSRCFRCPCHGSSFAADGKNLDGPAPRALDRFAVCTREGRLIVNRSRRFRREQGEWEHPDSFVSL